MKAKDQKPILAMMRKWMRFEDREPDAELTQQERNRAAFDKMRTMFGGRRNRK